MCSTKFNIGPVLGTKDVLVCIVMEASLTCEITYVYAKVLAGGVHLLGPSIRRPDDN